MSKEELEKLAFSKVLQFITNTFYADPDNPILISLEKDKGSNYYDERKIVLSTELMDAFKAHNLPRFIVYYHELGHLLYSKGYFKLIRTWRKITNGPLAWSDKYSHLFNWIEDFYMEDKLIKEHSYLTDVIRCITRLPPEYDINRIEYAFNFYYVNKAPTPALSYLDQVSFITYIKQLMTLRDYQIVPFGNGVLSNLAIRPSNDTKFALLLIEFYDWCVSRKIFPPDKPLPELSTPINHLEVKPSSGAPQPVEATSSEVKVAPQEHTESGSYSDHSKEVGKIEYEERLPVKKPADTGLIKDELVQENKLIDKEMLDLSQIVQSDRFVLDGLFTNRYKKTSVTQSKVIIPNFYNPNRLLDQGLFKRRRRSYMNVAIYRDISGSVGTQYHKLMHEICELLMEHISVPITYYLYASGKISVVEIPYVPWEDLNDVPTLYEKNRLFKQLEGGTNSSAIADVITQQFSDKWLNIIITDGDLADLMRRDNIMALLKNVFVVSIGSQVEPGLLGVTAKVGEDISHVIPTLASIKM